MVSGPSSGKSDLANLSLAAFGHALKATAVDKHPLIRSTVIEVVELQHYRTFCSLTLRWSTVVGPGCIFIADAIAVVAEVDRYLSSC